MREMTSEELKKIGIEVLVFIDEICRKNNIQYFILFGALIGAVRHKGYIPWDDDIDIGMTRENYNRFIKVMQGESRYRIISMETDSDYYFTFARVSDNSTKLVLRSMREIHDWGVFVDVFPLDNAPQANDTAEYFKQFRALRKKVAYTTPSTAKYHDMKIRTIARRIRRFPKRIVWGTKNFDKYRQELHSFMTQYNGTQSDRYVVSETPYLERAIFEKKWFEDCVELEFEKHFFWAPSGYDALLRHTYGDYMKLPPVEEQKSHHHFTAYWKE